jgi:diguanylate cyclase (GGDEF)-like protein
MSSTLPLPSLTPPVVAAFPALGRFGLAHFPVERRTRPRPPSQFVDPVTGLLNRAGLEDAVTTMFESGATPPGFCALLCVDLGGPDVLAAIAATAGLGGRDAVLREAAAALLGAVRGADAVGRLAGDDFVIVLEGLGELGNAARSSEAAAAALRRVRVPASCACLAPRIGVMRMPNAARTVAWMFAARERAVAAS